MKAHSRDQVSLPFRPSRREFVLGGAALLGSGALALVVGQNASAATAVGATKAAATGAGSATASTPTVTTAGYVTDGVRHYTSSQATLSTMTVTTMEGQTPSSGYLFATPLMDIEKGAIFDNTGEPVWISDEGEQVFDLRVQTYRGRSVLTYTTGDLIDGYGIGKGVILNHDYQVVAEVHAGRGLAADLHEFLLTKEGTALITAYPMVQGDLTSVGGAADGYYLDCHIQEIDITTGEVLLDWAGSDHIALTESYLNVSGNGTSANPYDPYHFNAIAVDYDGEGKNTLLLSARHTHAIYSINRVSGAVNWRMNGKKSDYAITEAAQFAWQHHVTRQSISRITVFDNHALTGDDQSRGLQLAVDEKAMTVDVARQYEYNGRLGTSQGSVQHLANGRVMVNWGSAGALTEFTANGTPVWDVAFTNASYRGFRAQWTGTPTTLPSVAAVANGSGEMEVYVTWNGATEVAKWRFLTGSSAKKLTAAKTVKRAGFETSVSVPSAKYVRAVALDSKGRVLGRSDITPASTATTAS